MEVLEEGIATKENPNIVMSMFEERIVGCICELILERFVYTSCLLVCLFKVRKNRLTFSGGSYMLVTQ